ncbi:hypothetical protein N7505_001981 [Penicillium chrysogenum]|uniref:HNH nuclease domain-containing protein n=1 Tax=Penicillium chrysogenum TaxID=5076 RepID=A0ABQ8WZ77_PENCH|nr:hypothetical protein N7505_001981 [Penicillium chrysogenum]
MDAQTLIRRHDVLKNLHQRVNDCESFFLSPSDLQGLGIQAFGVGITEDGILQFHPYTSKISNDGPPKLDNCPDFDSILKNVLTTYPNAEDPMTVAYEEAMMVSGPDEWESHAFQTQYYMSWHIDTHRKGRPTCSSLMDLGSLRLRRTEKKRNDPPISEHAFGLCWRIQTLFHDSEENAPLPHAIIDTVAHVPANHADQSLTLHEVRAIVNMMLIRTSHRPFRRYSIHPLLAHILYGRTTRKDHQASFDGENLILQYSPLWSFEDDDTAPVELFIRYYISQLVGLERADASVRGLAESVALMDLE